ncbi:MAG: hypothetical protein HQM10_26265 [Candidatus Riflebacteria bacterium]|nr:hypothetical protein [Candidatus Riflebacteria bacterium]
MSEKITQLKSEQATENSRKWVAPRLVVLKAGMTSKDVHPAEMGSTCGPSA